MLDLLSQSSNIASRFLPDACRSPDNNIQTSQDSANRENASLKALADPHLPLALLSQAHKDWGSVLALAPQTQHPCLSQTPAGAVITKFKRLEITCKYLVLTLKALAHPHMPLALLA